VPPQGIIDTYNSGTSPGDRLKKLWDAFGDKTIERIGEGCLCLGEIWAGAWKEGGGESIAASKLVAIDTAALERLYNDKTFIPSVGLKSLIELLTPSAGDAAAQDHAPPARRKRARKRMAA